MCERFTSKSFRARWYNEGLNAFEQTCPMGMALFSQFADELEKVRSNSTALSENEFSGLLKQTKTAREKLKIELEKRSRSFIRAKFLWR